MKVEANTIDEFFAACGDGQADMRQLAKVIEEVLGEKAELGHGSGTMTGLGWRYIDYKPKSAPKSAPTIRWPMIGIAPQKHHLALYVCAVKDGKYLAETYKDDLGKVSCGKSCIRFKKFEDLDLITLKKMLAEAKDLDFGF